MILPTFGRTLADYGSPQYSVMVEPITTLWQLGSNTVESRVGIAVNQTGSDVTTVTYPIVNEPTAIKVTETPAGSATQTVPYKSENSTWLWVGIAAVAAIAVGVGIYMTRREYGRILLLRAKDISPKTGQ